MSEDTGDLATVPEEQQLDDDMDEVDDAPEGDATDFVGED